MKSPFLRRLISSPSAPDRAEFHEFMDRVIQGEINRHEVVAFLAGLSAKPLCVEDIVNFVSYLFRVNPAEQLKSTEDAVNIVGTGGGISTFNISTAVAFVASAAGAKVLKSGSTAYTSQCGSLDVLDELSVPMPQNKSQLADMIDEFGLGFVPAAHYGVLLRVLATKVLPLEFRDLAGFINTIGPLLCPYRVSGQLIGVGRFEHLDVFAEALLHQNSPKTLLVHADCGMDEFCSVGINHCRLIGGGVQRFSLSSQKLGFSSGSIGRLAGGTVKQNALILREVLSGKSEGEAKDTVILNSAALLFIAGVAPSIEDGIKIAAMAIDEGKAIRQLERVIEWGQQRTSHRFVAPVVRAKGSVA